MKGSMAYLRAAVVGFALVAGGRAIYENRDRLKREWGRIRDLEGLKGLTSDLSIGNILGSVDSIKNIAGQLSRLKQS